MKKWIFFALLLCGFELSARQRVQGYCEVGGRTVTVGGLSGTPKVMGAYPNCTVTVYLTGTVTPATIYSDNSSTPLANPFTASSTGLWFWYADNGRYDVRLSGGGIPSPFTLGDILLADPSSAGGSVTSFTGNQGTTRQNAVVAIAEDYTFRQISNGPFLVSSDYTFTAQQPGGSLIVGSNTITMTPCPLGVNGSNTNHYLYVSGGTGTAEAVLLTGGTCTSNATTGTIIVTAANTHSGAWTIQSATAGIQEAIWSIATYGRIVVPAGILDTYGTITFPASKAIGFSGAGMVATSIRLNFAAGDGILYDATTYALASISDFGILPSLTRTSGYDLHVKGATFGIAEKLLDRNSLNAFQFENCNSIFVDHLTVQSFTGNGFFLNASGSPTSGGFYSHLTAVGLGVNAMLIQAAAGSAFAGTEISDCNFQLATNLINMFPNGGTLNEFQFSNIILDTWAVRGMWLQTGSGTGNGISMRGFRVGTSSGAGFALSIASNWTNWLVDGWTGGAAGQGIVFNGARNGTLSNSQIAGDGTGAAGNIALTIQADGGNVADNIRVVNNKLGLAEDGTTGGGTSTIGVSVTAAAHTNLRFFGNTTYGNGSAGTASFVFAATGAGNIATNNNFIGHTSPAVASAATLPFPAEQDFFTVTGTTNVTAVSGLVQGQKGSFVPTGGTLTFTAGGTIGNSYIAVQNKLVNWSFDGTKVWFGGQDPSLSNTYNYIATEGGANNAITGTLTGVTLGAGLRVTVQLAHTLQAGANTFNLNGGGAVAIKSSRNVANNIGTAYAATGTITLHYDGTRWVDVSQ